MFLSDRVLCFWNSPLRPYEDAADPNDASYDEADTTGGCTHTADACKFALAVAAKAARTVALRVSDDPSARAGGAGHSGHLFSGGAGSWQDVDGAHHGSSSFGASPPPLLSSVRAAVTVGTAHVGNVGSSAHFMAHTCIGETVREAEKLAEHAQSLEVPVITSEAVWERLGRHRRTREGFVIVSRWGGRLLPPVGWEAMNADADVDVDGDSDGDDDGGDNEDSAVDAVDAEDDVAADEARGGDEEKEEKTEGSAASPDTIAVTVSGVETNFDVDASAAAGGLTKAEENKRIRSNTVGSEVGRKRHAASGDGSSRMRRCDALAVQAAIELGMESSEDGEDGMEYEGDGGAGAAPYELVDFGELTPAEAAAFRAFCSAQDFWFDGQYHNARVLLLEFLGHWPRDPAGCRMLSACNAICAILGEDGGEGGEGSGGADGGGGAVLSGGVATVTRDFIKSIPVFHNLEEDAIIQLCHLFLQVSYEPGEMIIREGEEGDSFFVVQKGSVDIYKKKVLAGDGNVAVAVHPDSVSRSAAAVQTGMPDLPEAVAAKLKRKEAQEVEYGTFMGEIPTGKFFGEQSLLEDRPRAATILASSGDGDGSDAQAVVCLELSRGNFERVVSSVPALLRDHAATHRQVALDDDSFLALQHHVALYEGLSSVAVQSQAKLLLDADETKCGGGDGEQKAGGGDDSGAGAGGAAGASSPGTVALATPRWMGQTTKAVNARKFSFTRILAPARAAGNDEAYRAELYMTVHACMYPEMDTIDAVHQLVRTARRACGADVARLFILSWPDEDAEKDNDDGGVGGAGASKPKTKKKRPRPKKKDAVDPDHPTRKISIEVGGDADADESSSQTPGAAPRGGGLWAKLGTTPKPVKDATTSKVVLPGAHCVKAGTRVGKTVRLWRDSSLVQITISSTGLDDADAISATTAAAAAASSAAMDVALDIIPEGGAGGGESKNASNAAAKTGKVQCHNIFACAIVNRDVSCAEFNPAMKLSRTRGSESSEAKDKRERRNRKVLGLGRQEQAAYPDDALRLIPDNNHHRGGGAVAASMCAPVWSGSDASGRRRPIAILELLHTVSSDSVAASSFASSQSQRGQAIFGPRQKDGARIIASYLASALATRDTHRATRTGGEGAAADASSSSSSASAADAAPSWGQERGPLARVGKVASPAGEALEFAVSGDRLPARVLPPGVISASDLDQHYLQVRLLRLDGVAVQDKYKKRGTGLTIRMSIVHGTTPIAGPPVATAAAVPFTVLSASEGRRLPSAGRRRTATVASSRSAARSRSGTSGKAEKHASGKKGKKGGKKEKGRRSIAKKETTANTEGDDDGEGGDDADHTQCVSARWSSSGAVSMLVPTEMASAGRLMLRGLKVCNLPREAAIHVEVMIQGKVIGHGFHQIFDFHRQLSVGEDTTIPITSVKDDLLEPWCKDGSGSIVVALVVPNLRRAAEDGTVEEASRGTKEGTSEVSVYQTNPMGRRGRGDHLPSDHAQKQRPDSERATIVHLDAYDAVAASARRRTSTDPDASHASQRAAKFANGAEPWRAAIPRPVLPDDVRVLVETPLLRPPTLAEKAVLLAHGDALSAYPNALRKFVQCIDFAHPGQVSLLHRELSQWAPLPFVNCLEILSLRCPDIRLRRFVVRCLAGDFSMAVRMDDKGLTEYILQMVQSLRDEPFVDSALSRFLLTRALRNPVVVGHRLYWYLTAEMGVLDADEATRTRFGTLLELLLRHCGPYRYELGQQAFLLSKLEYCADAVKNTKHATKDGRTAVLRECLAQVMLVLPSSFQLPLYPELRFRSIVLDKCRVMDSKKKPLWLCFELAPEDTDDADGGGGGGGGVGGGGGGGGGEVAGSSRDLTNKQHVPRGGRGRGRGRGRGGHGGGRSGGAPRAMVARAKKSRYMQVLFKAGDDLRQDQLTLQIMRILQTLWEEDGIDARMTPYGCVATGNELGMLEVVDNAATLAGIVAETAENKGGKLGKRLGAALDALGSSSDSLATWLAKQHEAASAAAGADAGNIPSAVLDNFVRSCAGYCVATHVLGIGDRHNDNIMLTKSGKLLHIDFGHFLGNFKSKFGYKRETAPFVFTPAMAEVLGGTDSAEYNAFVQMSCTLYRAVRKHARLITTLFVMMIPSGKCVCVCVCVVWGGSYGNPSAMCR